ncbi:MAG: hypothetical protein IJQ82_03130 [Selenomonadaceae bacterium]|nr:hypothetical protein [Selenomonadaceae bacterium]
MKPEHLQWLKNCRQRTEGDLDTIKRALKYNDIKDKSFKAFLLNQRKVYQETYQILTEIINDNEECANPS